MSRLQPQSFVAAQPSRLGWRAGAGVAALCSWATWTACSGSTPAPPAAESSSRPDPRLLPGAVSQPPNGSLAPVYIDADQGDTYSIFVLRTLSLTEKSTRWAHYYDGRWVRWCGELKFFTHDGLQFRYFSSSESYDIELQVPEPQKTALRTQLTIGRFYNYVGRLGHFDESFRILTLDQGTVLRPDEFGVPSYLLDSPNPIWRIGTPPRVVAP